jgi:hypothetical protein
LCRKAAVKARWAKSKEEAGAYANLLAQRHAEAKKARSEAHERRRQTSLRKSETKA